MVYLKKMKITHLKGTHFSLPMFFKKVKPTVLTWKATFSKDSIYDVDVDQSDWNKLCGIKWDYFQPRENAIMCGWRYVEEQKVFQLTCYFHENKSVNTGVLPLIDVPVGKEVNIKIDFKKEQKIVLFTVFTDESDKKIVRLDWDLFDDGYLINSWFGGNRVPNKTVKFELDYI